MAIGLFDRQAPIGLQIPEWITIYSPAGRRLNAALVSEIVEGAAVMGAKGVTLMRGSYAGGESDDSFADLVSRIRASIRPWFRGVACDVPFFEQRRGEIAVGRCIYLADSQAGAAEDPPPGVVGEWAIAIDGPTSMVGKTASPSAMVADATDGRHPCRQEAHWDDDFSHGLLSSATVLLALNVLCKPARFRPESVFFASEFMDASVAGVMAERGLRPRWR